jgi:hypothetical protein
MVERGLGFSTIIEEVGQVDPGLAITGIDLERPPQPVQRSRIVAEPVRRVAETRGGVGRLRMRGRCQVEETVRRGYEPLPE